jgi:hypothetical protein
MFTFEECLNGITSTYYDLEKLRFLELDTFPQSQRTSHKDAQHHRKSTDRKVSLDFECGFGLCRPQAVLGRGDEFG